LALYIHWPFCVSKCPYCDFNSHVREAVDQGQWRDALLAELAYEAEAHPRGPLGSIFFGGGTPSLMPPETVAALIEAAERHWGLQALDEEALRFLGRAHGLGEGLAALDTAQAAFQRVSFDLIYALPGQSEEAWAAELARALSFGTGHLSLYQLTIEPGTRFAALAAKGELPETDPDHAASLYEITQALTQAAGLPAYEISNHARPGEESRHNLAYWRYRPYLGVGPGAHGRRGAYATQRHKKPENWLKALARNGHGIAQETPLTPHDEALEKLLMGLRLHDGVVLAEVEPALDLVGLARMEKQGLVERTGGRLIVAPRGMLLLDAILAEVAKT
jgi:oxygen-independent coproporphyrinogen-3 oxidase